MTTRKIATSTLWQLGSQGIAMILGILSIKLVTTALSKELVGNYQTVYSYLQIFGILADFGLYAIAVRELSKAEDFPKTFANIFLLRLCITLLSLGGAILIAFALPTFRGTPLPPGIAMASLVPFFTLLGGVFRSAFQVHYRMHLVFLAEITSKLIPVCLMFVLVYQGVLASADLQHYYVFLGLGAIGAFSFLLFSLWFARSLPTAFLAFSKDEFCRLIKLSAPFGLAFLATTLYRQMDLTLIAILRPDYELQNAYYGIVHRITEMTFLLPTFVMNSVLPMLTNLSGEQEQSDLLGTVLFHLATLGVIVSLFAFLWAKPLILLLTQASYLGSTSGPGSDTALQLLSPAMFLSFIVTYCFYLLLHRHRWVPLLLVTSVAAVFSLTLNVLLIPALGFVGAGITSIFTHLFLAMSLMWFARGLPRFAHGLPGVCPRFASLVFFTFLLSGMLYYTREYAQSSMSTITLAVAVLAVSGGLLWLLGLLPGSILRGKKPE